jgi:hypothetical protein
MPAVTKNLTIEQKATFRKKLTYRDKFKKPINLTGYGAVQIDWHKGQTVRRDWPALKVVQSLLNMTDRQIDELFVMAGDL